MIPGGNPVAAGSTELTLRRAYIDIVKRIVTNFVYLGDDRTFEKFNFVDYYDLASFDWRIEPISRPLTLLNKGQLDLLEHIALDIEARLVPGDFMEAGIWRGGVIVFLRALLFSCGITDRKVFGADSFEGIPLNEKFRHDPVDEWQDRWVASFEEVRSNIARLGYLDNRTVLIPGYFKDTLPSMNKECFSLIRLDCDAFDSVTVSLEHLYPCLSKGGVVIIDDWHLIACKMAVGMYRDRHGIIDPIAVTAGNAYWVKQQSYGEPAAPTFDHPQSHPPRPNRSKHD